ncbi:oxidoreductase [Syntrophomonas wolfei]|uniref:oxidoreductase n=1 Tax=Syntrophomonas wolfei TaxID=863 RepID=UPI0007748748|nr:oxidoreductase [Syntrophomonas wolfei]
MNKYISRFSLDNKTIIITGACGLLGREICKALAELHARIVLADIDIMAAEKLQEELRDVYGASVTAFPLDISSEDSVNKLVDELSKQEVSIDGLVNNAYPRNITYGTIFENITMDSWRENIDMHLNGYFNVSQKIARVMMQQRQGNIVNITSIYGMLGPDFSIYEGTTMTMPAEYAAIKGAIINFTRYLATYLAAYNIRVNCLSPGGIFNEQLVSFVEKYKQRTPMGRMGKPEDIAGGVLFLLSNLSSYMTGQNLVIDGGWSAW